jgi:ADP-ribose pyrophosphatase YjhB (NUDIX family)
MNIEKAKKHEPKKLLNLGIARRGDRILLAMKKRGFGEGWWNGYGGKVEAGESIIESLEREIREESGGLVPKKLEQKGMFWFEFEGKPEILEVHLFEIMEFEGEPSETEEMRPEWFAFDAIPYDDMWPPDRHWIPVFLSGKKLEGYFHFTADKKLLDFEVVEL